ncbi:hypothetical protein AB0M36_07360 [Actinoplanes sp. NPDC051346]|uniref:hypothetical protein n=1 Tax=Actinoplanes sp. NPDC051346 TaxID=3155048 RepID=UPI00341EA327
MMDDTTRSADLVVWQGMIGFAITLVVVSLLVVYATRQFRQAWEARARSTRDDAFRDLAAEAVAGRQAQTVELAALRQELAEVKAETAAIHHMLRQVG